MPDEPKQTSDRACKRTAGEILREALIKRREGYFDLLVLATALSTSRATRKRARPRSVVLSIRPWRSGNSMRRGLRPPSGRAADQGVALR